MAKEKIDKSHERSAISLWMEASISGDESNIRWFARSEMVNTEVVNYDETTISLAVKLYEKYWSAYDKLIELAVESHLFD